MRNSRHIAMIGLAIAGCGVAHAQDSNAKQIVIPVPEADVIERRTVSYACGDRTVSADYINAGAVSVALLHADGQITVVANVTAASGAKYMGGPYTWWTKGEAATFYDLRNGENATGIECRAVK